MNYHSIQTVSYTSSASIIMLRWLASIIDYLLIFGLFAFYFYSLGENNTAISFFICVAIVILYYIVLEGLTGYSLGKLICRIKVVNAYGNTPGIVKSIIRTLFRLLEINPLLFGGIIAAIVALSSSHKQRIGDLVAKTYVIKVIDLKKHIEFIQNQIRENEPGINEQNVNESDSNNSVTGSDVFGQPYADDMPNPVVQTQNTANNPPSLNTIPQQFRSENKNTQLIAAAAVSVLFVLGFLSAIIYSIYFKLDIPNSGRVITSEDKTIQLSLPDGWSKNLTIKNTEFELSAIHQMDGYMVAVVKIKRQDYADDMTLGEYCDLKLADLKESISDGTAGEVSHITITNYPAAQFEYFGTEDQYKIHYLFTAVDTGKDIYQIVGWSSQSTFQFAQDDILAIADSFHLTSQKKENILSKYPNQKGNVK